MNRRKEENQATRIITTVWSFSSESTTTLCCIVVCNTMQVLVKQIANETKLKNQNRYANDNNYNSEHTFRVVFNARHDITQQLCTLWSVQQWCLMWCSTIKRISMWFHLNVNVSEAKRWSICLIRMRPQAIRYATLAWLSYYAAHATVQLKPIRREHSMINTTISIWGLFVYIVFHLRFLFRFRSI